MVYPVIHVKFYLTVARGDRALWPPMVSGEANAAAETHVSSCRDVADVSGMSRQGGTSLPSSAKLVCIDHVMVTNIARNY